MTVAGGIISQKRLTDTWLKVEEIRAKRARAGAKGNKRNVHAVAN
jgi:hypothetical protein